MSPRCDTGASGRLSRSRAVAHGIKSVGVLVLEVAATVCAPAVQEVQAVAPETLVLTMSLPTVESARKEGGADNNGTAPIIIAATPIIAVAIVIGITDSTMNTSTIRNGSTSIGSTSIGSTSTESTSSGSATNSITKSVSTANANTRNGSTITVNTINCKTMNGKTTNDNTTNDNTSNVMRHISTFSSPGKNETIGESRNADRSSCG